MERLLAVLGILLEAIYDTLGVEKITQMSVIIAGIVNECKFLIIYCYAVLYRVNLK